MCWLKKRLKGIFCSEAGKATPAMGCLKAYYPNESSRREDGQATPMKVG